MFAVRFLALLASAIVGGVFMTFPGPQAWLGGGLLFAGLVTLWVECREESLIPVFLQRFVLWIHEGKIWRIRVMDVIALFGLFGICWALLPRGLKLQPPLSHDHMIHYVKAHRLINDMLSQGVLWGWSNDWFAGFPVNYLYPFGGDLWVAFVYSLGFGKLNLMQAYALAFWLHWLLVGVGLYAVSRRLFSPWVGLAAVVMFWIDIGSSRLGGGVFTVDFGVWPISLSVGFGLLAVHQLKNVLLEDSWKSIGWFGLWMGLALLSHPIQLVHFVAMFPVSLIALYVSRSTHRWLRPILRLSVAFAIGAMVAGIWLFPFFSLKSWTQSYGLPWMDIDKYSKMLLFLRYLKGTNVWILAIGLLGLVRFLMGRRFFSVYIGLFSLLLLVFSQRTILEVLHLPTLLPSIKNIQFIRFAYLYKPFLFLGGAWLMWEGVLVLGRHIQTNWLSRDAQGEVAASFAPRTSRLYIQVLIVSGLLCSLLMPILHQVKVRHFFHIQNDYKTIEKDPFYVSKLMLQRWFLRNKKKWKGFYRVAIWENRNSHWLHDLDILLDVPTYKIGSTPAVVFKYKVESPDPKILRYLNVRFIVTHRRKYSRYLKYRYKFHKLYVYEFRDWNPLPFTITSGKGPVKLVKMERENVVLNAGSSATGYLNLHIAQFPRWKATHNGKPIKISSYGFPNLDNFSIMRVKLQPGTYEFTFKRGLPEWLGALASGLGGILAFSLLGLGWIFRRSQGFSSQVRSMEGRILRLEERASSWVSKLVPVGLILGIPGLVLLILWKPRVPEINQQQRKYVKSINVNLADDLNYAKITERLGRRNYRCRMRKNMWRCRRYRIHKRSPITQTYLDAWDSRPCIWTDPRSNSTAVIKFPAKIYGTALVGEFTLLGRPTAAFHDPTEVKVFLNDRLVYTGRTFKDIVPTLFRIPFSPDLQHTPIKLKVEIRPYKRSRKYFCLRMFGVEEHDRYVVKPSSTNNGKSGVKPRTRSNPKARTKLPVLRLAPAMRLRGKPSQDRLPNRRISGSTRVIGKSLKILPRRRPTSSPASRRAKPLFPSKPK